MRIRGPRGLLLLPLLPALLLLARIPTSEAHRDMVAQVAAPDDLLPAQSCDDALAHGLDLSAGTPAPPPPTVLSRPALPTVSFSTTPAQGKPRPGPDAALDSMDPRVRALQPLEGAVVDLWRVGDVLRRADAGERVRITVFGASHTGGDFWTGHLRRVLQSRYGDGGHGFVLPAALYAGDRASDINLCRTTGWRPDYVGLREGRGDGLLGLGMSVSSSDPADFGWLETTRDNPHGRQVDRLRLFALAQPGGGSLRAQVDRQPALTLATDGPDIELLQAQIEVLPGAHRFTLSPVGDGEVRLLGASLENAGPGIVVDAIGVRGRQARHMLQWDPVLARDMLTALRPDMVVLAYGTNEAADSDYTMEAYARDLRAALQRVRDAAPHAACVLVGPSDRGVWPRGKRAPPEPYARTAPVAQVQREVAPEFGCVFWDWQQATGGAGSMIAWQQATPSLAAGDLIHFSVSGYIFSAERFLAALDAVAQTPLPLLEAGAGGR